MFLLFYLIFSVNGKNYLMSRYNIGDNVLSKINDNYIFLDPDNVLDLKSRHGVCQIDFDEIPIETIHDNFLKKELLKNLLNENVSVFDKLELIKQNDYLINKEDPFDDLLDDWNNIF